MKERFLYLHLKKQIVSLGQYQDKLEKITSASLNMAGEQRKEDRFMRKNWLRGAELQKPEKCFQ